MSEEEEGTKIVKFNVGGIRHEVARSLLELHPDTMLARMVSEQWQENPDTEIFIERDGSRFKYVLDYLRDGKVQVPVTLAKESLLNDIEYFSISFETENVSYSESGLYASALSIPKMIEMLANEEKKAAHRAEMFEFAKECVLQIVGADKLRKVPSLQTRLQVYKKDENEERLYSLCKSMSIVMNNPSQKDELLGICRRCGFVPIGIKAFSRKNQIGWEVSISY